MAQGHLKGSGAAPLEHLTGEVSLLEYENVQVVQALNTRFDFQIPPAADSQPMASLLGLSIPTQ